jgi:photosystem II stability/assembly factor-like uncharacterized protein
MAFVVFLSLGVAVSAQQASSPSNEVEIKVEPAHAWPNALDLMYLGIANAGARLVAVGEHGVVLLSDDNGVTFRQAKSVPASSTLTAVTFVDEQHGWAVGQWGVILATTDGGETWQLQRSDTSTDQPFFSVYFKDKDTGWAVGLWSMLYVTVDGGKSWTPLKVPPPPGSKRADRNFYKIFSDGAGALYICSEQGMLLVSRDQGQHWDYVDSGYRGSFWTGVADDDGTLFVAGLRGHVYRSKDHGVTWYALETDTTASITGLKIVGGTLFGVGLDGTTLSGDTGGNVLATHKLRMDTDLTGLALTRTKKVVVTSRKGVIPYDN